MHHLGVMLENGRGTARDLSEAISWYERAAALEYPPALNELGRLYLAGAGVPKNYVRAKASFEQAAQRGDTKAMNNLGLLYLYGMGVRRDFDLARTWFERAIALNDADAQKNLKILEETAPLDGAKVAARRASCMETCVTLHRSYVTSICDRYSATADGDRPERTTCIGKSLAAARQCRDSCREWAPTRLEDNKCTACFQTLIACSIRQQPPDGQGNDRSYAADSQACLAASADCTANCRRALIPTAGAPDASAERPN
jgi:TPR repeat protein